MLGSADTYAGADRSSCSADLVFQTQVIRDHGDKLAVRRLSAVVLYSVSEIRVQGIYVAAIPCNLDSVAYCTLHTGGRCRILLCNRWVQHLRYRVDYIVVAYSHQYCRAKVLISFYMGRHPDLVDYLCYLCFDIGGSRIGAAGRDGTVRPSLVY